MTRGSFAVLAALLSVAAAAAGYLVARQQQAAVPVTASPAAAAGARVGADVTGQPRPAFSLPDLDGVERHVAEWDGKVLVINFWATWCPPCRKEIPEFIDLQDHYRERGLQFLGVALEQPEPVRKFAAALGINYPLLAGELPVIGIAEAYGDSIGALPYTAIIDRDGRIRFTHAGPLSRDKAEEMIRSLL